MHKIGHLIEKNLDRQKEFSGLKKNHSRNNANHLKHNDRIFDFLALINRWEFIVGKKMSEYTIPLKNKNKSLFILTNHSALSQQLSFMSDIIIQKITNEFPSLKNQIEKLQFIVDTTYFESHKEKHLKRCEATSKNHIGPKKLHPFSPEYRKYSDLAKKSFDHISDDEVKSLLCSIYIQIKAK